MRTARCIYSMVGVLLLAVTPSFAETNALIGAGPDIGLWDVADGHHSVGFHGRAMVHVASEKSRSFRLDGAFTNFWAEGSQNEDYREYAIFANIVIKFSAESAPYWTIGAGWDGTNTDDGTADDGGFIFGAGVGTRLGWGNLEARFDLANTPSGLGAHIPLFAALRF